MPSVGQFIDISAYQNTAIDWQKYKVWSAAGDGISRISLRSSYGTGFSDIHYAIFRKAAEQAEIDVIIHYHYAYPSLNSAIAEADWQFKVVGAIRPNDVLMLDFEENVVQADAAWALAWLERQEQNYGGKLPTIYASDAYIRARLQDARLARFPLTLANWQFTPTERPPCPPPWTSYTYLQYTDKATNIPGITGAVDANIYLGGATTSTTIELANFPMISQRDSDKNADFDCVPASIAACLQWLTGKAYTASEVKDAVYGASYTGGTAAIKYVDYCASQGVSLAPINGTGAALVTALHGSLAEQHPCLITEPDPYAAGWTHVCAAYKCDASSITVMDPWIDAPVTKSDAQWASQLEFNQIWILELEKDMPVPAGWSDDGHTLTAPNKVPVILGFRDHILQASSWDAGNQPCEAEYHTNQVLLHNASVGAGTAQLFRDSLLWYTSTKGVVQEPFMGLELDAAYKFISQLTQEIATLKAAQPAPTPAPVDISSLVAAINGIADGISPLVAAALVEAKKL